jgi:xanthine phosphoribosyltransferase
MIETISIATYEKDLQGEPRLLKTPAATADGEGWLIIDDLVDRGTTMRVVRGILPKARVGVLYAKPEGEPLADVFVRQFPQDSWLDFPWEMDFIG